MKEMSVTAGKTPARSRDGAAVRGRLRACLVCRLALAVLAVIVAGCSSQYRAPVNDVDGGPLYADRGRTHRVNQGETLYAIAWIYDLDYQDLARVNGLSPPYTLQPGDTLRVDVRNIDENSAAQASSVRIGSGREDSPSDGGSGDGGTTTARSFPARPSPTPSSRPAPSPPPETASPGGPPDWRWPAEGPVIGRFSSASNKGIDIGGRGGDAVLAAAEGEVVYAGRALLRYGDLIILKHNERFLSAYAHNSRLLVSEGERVRRGQKIAELGSTGIDRELLHFEIRLEGDPVDPLDYLPPR